MDRVWVRLKEAAQMLAPERRLETPQARAVVVRVFREEHVPPPPDEALEYLSGELMQFVDAARNAEPIAPPSITQALPP